ncbi:FabG Dehydrogenase [Pyrenophora teres f. maculata]|nr:FabG Dehydrogenase [Pyrenophora teres f. maculata]
MAGKPKTAFITGGASGIGRALTIHLLSKGWHVFIADLNMTGAKQLTDEHNTSATVLHYSECDTTSWEFQLSSFQQALKALGGRIDCVFPIAGISERKWLPLPSETNAMKPDEFAKPNLSVIDVDLTAVLYTVSLAVQQFRRQEPVAWTGKHQFRGKIGLVASICGFYCIPSVPIYTAAKHAIVGLTRSYGVLLKEEGITVNAVAPNVVRTAISSGAFYDKLEAEGVLTPMQGLMSAFDEILQSDCSALVYECGPKVGWSLREGAQYLDEESGKACDMIAQRSMALHYETK